MSKIYCLGIGHVDGVRDYQIVTPDTKEALEFYEKYGHEGDCINLNITEISQKGEWDTKRWDMIDDVEEIFRILNNGKETEEK